MKGAWKKIEGELLVAACLLTWKVEGVWKEMEGELLVASCRGTRSLKEDRKTVTSCCLSLNSIVEGVWKKMEGEWLILVAACRRRWRVKEDQKRVTSYYSSINDKHGHGEWKKFEWISKESYCLSLGEINRRRWNEDERRITARCRRREVET